MGSDDVFRATCTGDWIFSTLGTLILGTVILVGLIVGLIVWVASPRSPGGELPFYEHVVSSRPAMARVQRGLDQWALC